MLYQEYTRHRDLGPPLVGALDALASLQQKHGDEREPYEFPKPAYF